MGDQGENKKQNGHPSLPYGNQDDQFNWKWVNNEPGVTNAASVETKTLRLSAKP